MLNMHLQSQKLKESKSATNPVFKDTLKAFDDFKKQAKRCIK